MIEAQNQSTAPVVTVAPVAPVADNSEVIAGVTMFIVMVLFIQVFIALWQINAKNSNATLGGSKQSIMQSRTRSQTNVH